MHNIIKIMWPPFLAAILAEGCFFSLFEPQALLELLGLEDSPSIAMYTLFFLFFWAICFVASWLTYYLTSHPQESV